MPKLVSGLALLLRIPTMAQMLDQTNRLFGNSSRLRLMRLFLFSPKTLFSTPDIVARTGLTSNEIRRETKLLKESGLVRITKGKKTRIMLNEKFPYIRELQYMLLDSVLRRNSIYERLRRTGNLKFAGISGVFMGDFDHPLDLIIVGDRMRESKLKGVIRSLERDIGAELRYAAFPTTDFLYRLTISDHFVRDFFDYPHRVLHDRLGVEFK